MTLIALFSICRPCVICLVCTLAFVSVVGQSSLGVQKPTDAIELVKEKFINDLKKHGSFATNNLRYDIVEVFFQGCFLRVIRRSEASLLRGNYVYEEYSIQLSHLDPASLKGDSLDPLKPMSSGFLMIDAVGKKPLVMLRNQAEGPNVRPGANTPVKTEFKSTFHLFIDNGSSSRLLVDNLLRILEWCKSNCKP